MPAQTPMRIVFVLYPRLTQLDFTGPYEVLSRLPGAEVIIASKPGGRIASETGLVFDETKKLADIASCDLICIPGGPGQTEAMQDQAFMSEVTRLAASARYLTAVCTGSLILAATGLIKGKRAGSHWAYRELLNLFGVTPDGARVVRDGNVITGGGVTAGIDIALTIVAEVADAKTAKMIQLMIEYAPEPPFASGRPENAEPEIVEAVQKRFAAFRQARADAIEQMVS
jgi:transcriptional regulator GlxA family with amidase domain